MPTRILLILAFATRLFSVDEEAAEPILQDQKTKSSYALGMQMGGKLTGPSLDLDPDLVAQGLKDAMTRAKTRLSEAEMNAALKTLSAGFRAKQVEVAKQTSEKNKKQGEAFLAENKTREGVISLENGLQYKILQSGDGKKPAASDVVVCHYRGTLIDGTEFDSSYTRGQPATFPLSSLIPGWSQALQLMPVGSKWQLYIPSNLAYGPKGQRTRRGETIIGPNAALIFEVELLSIAHDVAAGDKGITGITFSFKLDPRITRGTYSGDRWVSPPSYTSTLDIVEARVSGVGPQGSVGGINAKWVPSDPEMVTVSPGEGTEVKIAVKRAGQATLLVTAGEISKELSVKAVNENNGMLVEIAQE